MIVYLLINKINGKKYVGQTLVSLDTRWQRHCWKSTNGSKHPMAITHAIRKHGKDNFTREVLCECKTQDELDEREKHFIAQLDTMSPRGYNVADGGRGGFRHSPETLAIIAEKNRGRHVTQKTREKLRQSGLGRVMSEATRKKMAKFWAKNRPSEAAIKASSHVNAKSYTLINPNGEVVHVTNMRQFCLQNSLSPSLMSEMVNGRRKHHKGWRI